MIVFWLGYAVLWLLLAMTAIDLWKTRSSALTRSNAARTLGILAGVLIAVHVALIVMVGQASGFASLIVAPLVAIIACAFSFRRRSMKGWIWLMCALPALIAFGEFALEVNRLAADIGEAWSRDWDFAKLFATANARLFFAASFSAIFFVVAGSYRLVGGRTK